jgi:hypothetical protein
MSRWLRKDPDKRYFRYTDVLAARPDMVEVSEEEALGKTQEQPAHESKEPAPGPDTSPSGAESSEGEPEDPAAYIDGLNQADLDAYAEAHPRIGQRPKHNMSLANQKLWVKQMLGVAE